MFYVVNNISIFSYQVPVVSPQMSLLNIIKHFFWKKKHIIAFNVDLDEVWALKVIIHKTAWNMRETYFSSNIFPNILM